MDSVFSWIEQLGPAGLVIKAILGSLLGIFLLIGFIVLRRWYRARYFQRRNARTLVLREVWGDILSGKVSPKEWRLKPLDSEIVESILLDEIDIADGEQLPALLHCLRHSGLLDMRVFQARETTGWHRRAALVALGRTRAPESIPALAEGLDDPSEETRIAAVRGLGRTGLKEAAVPLLDRLATGHFNVPEHALKNALVNCCRTCPSVLVDFLNHSGGKVRETLARVLGELATPELGDELLVLAADPLPEVRGSAARALSKAPPEFAISPLSVLAIDPEWFVRLRAVVALGSLEHSGKIKVLLRALCDSNRHVRQRAAWALARMEPHLTEILEQVAGTHDNYGLQAFISELERSGSIDRVVEVLQGRTDHYTAQAILLDALNAGRSSLEVAPKTSAATAGAR